MWLENVLSNVHFFFLFKCSFVWASPSSSSSTRSSSYKDDNGNDCCIAAAATTLPYYYYDDQKSVIIFIVIFKCHTTTPASGKPPSPQLQPHILNPREYYYIITTLCTRVFTRRGVEWSEVSGQRPTTLCYVMLHSVNNSGKTTE